MDVSLAVYAASRRRAPRRTRAGDDRVRSVTARLAPAGPAALRTAAGALLAVEIVLSLAMWSVVPLAWLWIGGQAFAATGSLMADGLVVLTGFAVTITLAMKALTHVDTAWIALRRRTGHEQRDGALTQVVVASATLGLIAFALWYYVFSDAYIIPFMPSR